MDLTQVRLSRISLHARTMLDRHTFMRVTFNALPCNNAYLRNQLFRETMLGVARNGYNNSTHIFTLIT
ncbi:hypothetical protein D3C72_2355460 [compost metagenome]